MKKLNLILWTISLAAILFSWKARATENQIAGLEIYGVVPSLFGDKPFKAVTEHLDALQDLGVNALWLSPINASDALAPISYSITDYFHLRPDLGTESDFRAMVKAAHDRGMLVLMDFVPNHTSNQHPYFLEAQTKGPASAYYDYYDRDEKGQPTHYFDWTNLLNLNYANPKVRDWITGAFSYWMDAFGIDGFRVDAAWGVKVRAPDFWRQLTLTLRKKHPHALLLAEASARDAFYYQSGFDLAYDWTDNVGQWAWEAAFSDLAHTGVLLKAALKANASPEKIIRFLNNNDTGDRFVTRHGPAVTKVASILTQTLPGVPVLFSGDEVGAEYSPYQGPWGLDWRDPNQLRDFQKNLIALRQTSPSLRSADIEYLDTPNTPQVLAYLRRASTSKGAQPLLVVLNFGPKSAQVSLSDGAFFAQASFVDLLSKQSIRFSKESSTWALDVPATTGFVIEGALH